MFAAFAVLQVPLCASSPTAPEGPLTLRSYFGETWGAAAGGGMWESAIVWVEYHLCCFRIHPNQVVCRHLDVEFRELFSLSNAILLLSSCLDDYTF